MAHPFATMVLDNAPLAVRPGLLMEDPVQWQSYSKNFF